MTERSADRGEEQTQAEQPAQHPANEPAIGRAIRPAIRIGTRGSQLALWQAHAVADALAARGDATEIVIIKTTGDRLSEAPLAEAGGKRLFVKELEDALLRREIDVAVHSAKDMPVLSADGLSIAAFLPREEPWDALVLPRGASHPTGLGDLTEAHATTTSLAPPIELALARIAPGATIGTSSIRRGAQLRRALPDARFAPIRGNLDTRLRKLDEGQFDAIVLATAGLKRLGATDRISARLPIEISMPAPGQGAIAMETRVEDEDLRARLVAIGDETTGLAVSAERALVDALGGGCQTPIGALARPVDGVSGQLDLQALVISLDGTRLLRASQIGAVGDPAALGRAVARHLLAQGAADILAELTPLEE